MRFMGSKSLKPPQKKKKKKKGMTGYDWSILTILITFYKRSYILLQSQRTFQNHEQYSFHFLNGNSESFFMFSFYCIIKMQNRDIFTSGLTPLDLAGFNNRLPQIQREK